MTETTQEPAEVEGHVFVVTYGRSGSTLIQNLLNSIPGYCIRGENSNALGPLVRSWHNVHGSRVLGNLARNQVATTSESPWYGGENIKPVRFGRTLARIFTREILSVPPGTRVAGFKEIRWIDESASLAETLNFLHRFFRNSRFIFNTRDHDEVARSGWWAKIDPDKVKARLIACEAAYTEYMASAPERCLHIHYNDYVADHTKLKPMFDFIGEPFDLGQVGVIMDRKLTHMKDDTA